MCRVVYLVCLMMRRRLASLLCSYLRIQELPIMSFASVSLYLVIALYPSSPVYFNAAPICAGFRVRRHLRLNSTT